MNTERSPYLARFAAATSVLALILVVVVAAVNSGSSSSETSTSAAPAPVAISLSEYAISPSKVTLPAGGSLTVTNAGTMAHNVTVLKTDHATPDIQPGGKATLDLSTLGGGTYEIYCAIPGHKDSGMTGTLTVTGSGSASGPTASSGEHDMGAMAGKSGSSSASTSSGTASTGSSASSADLSSMKPGSAAAEKMNRDMEKAMTGGLTDYLAWAKKYAA